MQGEEGLSQAFRMIPDSNNMETYGVDVVRNTTGVTGTGTEQMDQILPARELDASSQARWGIKGAVFEIRKHKTPIQPLNGCSFK